MLPLHYTYANNTLADAVGFEPTGLFNEPNTLAGCRFKPLIHASSNLAGRLGFEPREPFLTRQFSRLHH